MSHALQGIRVLEVAAWTFVPAAGAILADWGADVIKVEHPELGDPQRGLITMGIIPGGPDAVNYIIEQPNRGKRSIGLDISTEEGLEVLYRIAAESDVFLTSYLPQVRQKLKIDVEHIRAVNPNIVYVRGSGQGPEGPDATKGGYDGASYMARGGVAAGLTPPDAAYPVGGRPAFGDLAGGMAIAGGICAGLLQRANQGEAPVIDVSLLGMAMWVLSPDIVAARLYGGDPLPKFDRSKSPNPLVGQYKTGDDRFVTLIMLQSDKFWPDFCEHFGKPEWITDERFCDAGARFNHGAELIPLMDEHFASKTLAEWKEAFATMQGVWAPVQRADELPDDPQVIANGYLTTVRRDDGKEYELVANPVQFDGEHDQLTPAPEHGQQTEEILLELGYDWEQIATYKGAGAVL